MWVKICGNTNLEDAAQAAALGADAVGFVFAASRRQVTAAEVGAITPHLPGAVERVGVFDSQDAQVIADIAVSAGLTAVQLHGGLSEALLQRLGERLAHGVRVIQTLHWEVAEPSRREGEVNPPGMRLAEEMRRVAAIGVADRVLIDSKLGSRFGGTGVAFDWAAAREIFTAAPHGIKLIVAGGLRPETVAGAIAQLAPWGVDVSSGVEISPGRKDHALVAQFIANAHGTKTP